jgi:hypothetical protein
MEPTPELRQVDAVHVARDYFDHFKGLSCTHARSLPRGMTST